MRNWTIRQRILISFALVLALMIIMGGLLYSLLKNIEQDATNIQNDSLPGVFYSSQLAIAWHDNFALAQTHILEEDKARMEKIESRLLDNRARVDDLLQKYQRTIFRTADQEHFNALKSLRAPYIAAQEHMLKASGNPKSKPEAQALMRDRVAPEYEKIQIALQTVMNDNKFAAEESGAQIANDVVYAETGVIVSFAVALMLALICGYLLLKAITQPLGKLVGVTEIMRQGDFTQRLNLNRRDEFGALADGFNRMTDELTALVGQVQKSSIQVNTSITQIAATARQQQATASEIAATTTEIGATSKEISATSKELVKTMNDVATIAEQSAALAGSGHTGLTRMEDTMHHVMEAAGSINSKLSVLNEKAGNITQVVTTITKVADQTNLLSLNAAIEAEKAGEYGRGFSVVATEIRRLADQTAVATYDIEQMVKEIQSAVSAGVMGMDKFSEEVRRGMQDVQHIADQLSQIIQQVQTLSPRFISVNEGMQAQATGAEQISQALTQLSEAAQQTVDSLRQSNVAIDDLNQVANGLRNGVSRFKLA